MQYGLIYHGAADAPGAATTDLVELPSTLRASRILGSVRCDKTITLRVLQCPVKVEDTTHWLHKTDVSVSASNAEGGGATVSIACLSPSGAKVQMVNAGAAPANNGTALVSLWSEVL